MKFKIQPVNIYICAPFPFSRLARRAPFSFFPTTCHAPMFPMIPISKLSPHRYQAKMWVNLCLAPPSPPATVIAPATNLIKNASKHILMGYKWKQPHFPTKWKQPHFPAGGNFTKSLKIIAEERIKCTGSEAPEASILWTNLRSWIFCTPRNVGPISIRSMFARTDGHLDKEVSIAVRTWPIRGRVFIRWLW